MNGIKLTLHRMVRIESVGGISCVIVDVGEPHIRSGRWRGRADSGDRQPE